MPGGGDFVSFFRPGGRSFALKSCPHGGDFGGKISGPGVSPGGMVTCQIDTCISDTPVDSGGGGGNGIYMGREYFSEIFNKPM